MRAVDVIHRRDATTAEPGTVAGRRPISRRGFLLRGLGAAGLSATSTAVYAATIEPERLVTTSYRLTPPGWNAGRLSVVAIADLHAGGPNMLVEHISRVVEATNALRPDLVVLLGDYVATHRFVTERVAPEVWAGEFARLAAPLGVWAILGNHDWWHGVAAVRRALANVGIPCLENRAVLLGEGGARFWIAGLGDQLAHRVGRGTFRGEDDLPGTLGRVTTDHPVILLAHEPDIFVKVPPRVCLTLAGHTHGGQIRIPLLWPSFVPSRYGARFAYGHIVETGRHMIVSGGLGTSSLPVRLGMPPEIVNIEIIGPTRDPSV
jgi:predicted MPP superfamily phosphohydrolase